MNNAQWLYDQVPGPDDEDEGVHLSSAHALQIAGELERGSEALGKLGERDQEIARLTEIVDDATIRLDDRQKRLDEQEARLDDCKKVLWAYDTGKIDAPGVAIKQIASILHPGERSE